jgi:hypothetical protein
VLGYSAKTNQFKGIFKTFERYFTPVQQPFGDLFLRFTIWVEHKSVLERIIQHIDELSTTWKWLFNPDMTLEMLQK